MELQVGVKALICNSDGKYLVLARNFSKYDDIKRVDRWDIPGGRIIPGTPLIDNLKREVKEETGLDLSGAPRIIFSQDILRGSEKHVVRLTFLAAANSDSVVLDKEEHEAFAWLTRDELIKKEDTDTYLREVLKTIS